MNTRKEPITVIEDTESLSHEDWLSARKLGIGGSDVAGILGVSPWKTSLDIYYEKTGLKTAYSEESMSGIPLEMGTILEPYIATLYERETGNQVLKDTAMYAHPQYPFLLANIDFAVIDQKGRMGNLECKFSIEHNYEKWKDGRVPYHYELQGHHYAMVRDVEFTDFSCLFSNYKHIWRHVERDREMEENQLLPELCHFWEDHVLRLDAPDPSGEPDLILESLKHHLGKENVSLGTLSLEKEMIPFFETYFRLKEEEKTKKGDLKILEKKLTASMIPIVEKMNTFPYGNCRMGSTEVLVSFLTTTRKKVNWEQFQTKYPEIFEELVEYSTSRSLKVKTKELSR